MNEEIMDDELTHPFQRVILDQDKGFMTQVVLDPKGKTKLGKSSFKLDKLIGVPFLSVFRLVGNNVERIDTSELRVEQAELLERRMNQDSSFGVDTEESGRISLEEAREMQSDGISDQSIVAKMVNGPKYTNRPAIKIHKQLDVLRKRHFNRFRILKATQIEVLKCMQIDSVLNRNCQLTPSTMAMMMYHAQLVPGSRVAVVDCGIGFMAASVVQRVCYIDKNTKEVHGEVVCIYPNGHKFGPFENLGIEPEILESGKVSMTTFKHLATELGKKKKEKEKEKEKDEQEMSVEVTSVEEEGENEDSSSVCEIVTVAPSGPNLDKTATEEKEKEKEESATGRGRGSGTTSSLSSILTSVSYEEEQPKPPVVLPYYQERSKRLGRWLSIEPKRTDHAAVLAKLESGLDGLVFLCGEFVDPSSTLENLLPFLKYSRPFVCSCLSIEPLTNSIDAVRKNSVVRLAYAKIRVGFDRQYQIEPSRNRPVMNPPGFCPFVLSGLTTDPTSVEQNMEVVNTEKKRGSRSGMGRKKRPRTIR